MLGNVAFYNALEKKTLRFFKFGFFFMEIFSIQVCLKISDGSSSSFKVKFKQRENFSRAIMCLAKQRMQFSSSKST